METEHPEGYEPLCKKALRQRVLCKNCGKCITLRTLLYRHICETIADRVKRMTMDGPHNCKHLAEGGTMYAGSIPSKPRG